MFPLFLLTIFSSAFLLFQIQPMIAKLMLPSLGGAPAVWNVCMAYFQLALLGGYTYAHALQRYVALPRQPLVHAGVLLASLLWLPVGLHTLEGVRPETTPVMWLLAALTLSVFLPFFMLSANAPILQHWFASVPHRRSEQPWFLYAASNAGSMLALLSYPVAVEMWLDTGEQTAMWSRGYGGFALLIALCGTMVYKRGRVTDVGEKKTGGEEVALPGRRQIVRWVALAFVPSSLMLGVTTHITADMGAFPLFWIIPLALYLLTFVLTFSRWYGRRLHRIVLHVESMALALAVVLFASGSNHLLIIETAVLTFFLIALACHGELYHSRPAVRHLTAFYVWISVGGVLGGMFNALVAPAIFSTTLEYPITLILACLVRPRIESQEEGKNDTIFSLLKPVVMLGILLYMAAQVDYLMPWFIAWDWLPEQQAAEGMRTFKVMLLVLIAAIACVTLDRYPVQYAASVLVIVVLLPWIVEGGRHMGGSPVLRDRNFFGSMRVVWNEKRQTHAFFHGNTLHGVQSTRPEKRLQATSYYMLPMEIFEARRPSVADMPVGSVGLGVGTIACYGKSGQTMDFYEIDPAVEKIARDTRYFTYLSDCPPDIRVLIGDARLSLAEQPAGRYGLMVMDAFSSDSLPVHLFTREALAVHLKTLAPDGLIAFHISSRYYDLAPMLGALAGDAGLVAVVKMDATPPTDANDAMLWRPSRWVVMARREELLTPFRERYEGWEPLAASGDVRLWTDAYASILSVLNSQER